MPFVLLCFHCAVLTALMVGVSMCWLFSGTLSLFILHSIRHKRLECLQYHEYQQRLNLHLIGVAKIFFKGGGGEHTLLTKVTRLKRPRSKK